MRCRYASLNRRLAASCPDAYERAVRDIEWTLIRYPLPKLQRVGGQDTGWLYAIIGVARRTGPPCASPDSPAPRAKPEAGVSFDSYLSAVLLS